MIDLEQKVKIKWSTVSKNRYIELGYNFTRIGEYFEVSAKHLSYGSEAIVEVQCDFCGKKIYKSFKEYNCQKNDLEDCCKDCLQIKAKDSFYKKYGVSNPSYVDLFKEKREKTCVDKFGVKNVFELQEYQEMAKTSMINKYGVEHALSLKSFFEKSKNTLMTSYGVNNPMKSKELREKAAITNLERYGVECVLDAPGVRDKAIGNIETKPQKKDI